MNNDFEQIKEMNSFYYIILQYNNRYSFSDVTNNISEVNIEIISSLNYCNSLLDSFTINKLVNEEKIMKV